MPNQFISNKQLLRDLLQEQLTYLADYYPNKKLIIILDSIDQLVGLMKYLFIYLLLNLFYFLEPC